ncbi:hypothetical protein VTI74DRAFT_1177 [Chaetomium olivicolor]
MTLYAARLLLKASTPALYASPSGLPNTLTKWSFSVAILLRGFAPASMLASVRLRLMLCSDTPLAIVSISPELSPVTRMRMSFTHTGTPASTHILWQTRISWQAKASCRRSEPVLTMTETRSQFFIHPYGEPRRMRSFFVSHASPNTAALGSSRSPLRCSPPVLMSFSMRSMPALALRLGCSTGVEVVSSGVVVPGSAEAPPPALLGSDAAAAAAAAAAVAAAACARAMMVSKVGPCPSLSRSKLCSSRLCMLAMMRARMAATSWRGRLPLVASSWASICEAVRMWMARAEKSGWSTELFRELWRTVIFRRRGGLIDPEEPSEVRGVALSETAGAGVLAPDRRIECVDCAVLGSDNSSSDGFSSGELPRSPDAGSKTLSTTSSGVRETGGILGESVRSNILLLVPCSASSVVSSLWLSCVLGSKSKSSRKISTMSRYGTFSALFKTVASAGFSRTILWWRLLDGDPSTKSGGQMTGMSTSAGRSLAMSANSARSALKRAGFGTTTRRFEMSSSAVRKAVWLRK